MNVGVYHSHLADNILLGFQRVLLSIFLTVGLFGCGGGADSPTPGISLAPSASSTSVLSGAVVDGYIIGAKVCLDLNDNNICDIGEPYSVTTAGGQYAITYPAGIILTGKHLIAEVPVGAIDSDNPGVPLTKSFVLMAPAVSNGVVSPLTTMVSKYMKEGSSLAQAQNQVLADLGLPATFSFTADYIISGNVPAHNVARLVGATISALSGSSGTLLGDLNAALSAAIPFSASAYIAANPGDLATIIANATGAITPAPAGDPTVAPPTPTAAAGNVISVFGTHYGNMAGLNPNPNWGQATVVTQIPVGADTVLKMANFNYQGIDFVASPVDVTGKTTLHLDVYSEVLTSMNVFLISTTQTVPNEQAFAITLTNTGWNQIDIPLTNYTVPNLAAIDQLKFDTTQVGNTIYVDNIYFHGTAGGGGATVPGAPVGVVATAGDGQATVVFGAPASNGGSAITGYTVTSIPAGGVDSNAGTTGLSHIITGLTNGTSYTFTVHATNVVGNSVESAPSNAVTPTAAPAGNPTTIPAAPTAAPGNVISVWGLHYGHMAGANFNPGWGQSTVMTTVNVLGDDLMKLANLNYQGIDFVATPIDVSPASGMTNLHIDMYASAALTPVNVFLISTTVPSEQGFTVTPTVAGWNSFDIPLSNYTVPNLAVIDQMKFDAQPNVGDTIFIDNLYFWKPAATGLPGDRNGDGYVYLFATDPYAGIDLYAGTDYSQINAWGSGTIITDPYTLDGNYNPVMHLAPGMGWGASTASYDVTGFAAGFAAGYDMLNFKVKSMPTANVYVKFASGSRGPQTELAFPLNTYANLVGGTTGWYDVTVPLANFPDQLSYFEFAIHGGWGNGGPFLLTDVAFTGALTADVYSDGYVYLIATDPNRGIDLTAGGVDYSVVNWSSGSTFTNPYADVDYNPVWQVVNGTGWGAPSAAIAFSGFATGFSSEYKFLNFKIKGLPTTDVFVKFATGGSNPALDLEKQLPLATYATPIPGTTGWYQVTIPMSLFPDTAAYNEFGIHGGWNNGGTFYITDVMFDK